MNIFDGKQFAAQKETKLASLVQKSTKLYGKSPKVVSIVFTEDAGGVVYAKEKQLVASRVGIQYEIQETSISESTDSIHTIINLFADDSTFTGIIIQKPWRNTWELHNNNSDIKFQSWWESLTSLIPLEKDIDGLHPLVHRAINANTWREQKFVLPATCKAVISILEDVSESLNLDLKNSPTAIIGRSDLLGSPLFAELPNRGWKTVTLFGQKELQEAVSQEKALKEFKTIVSSTGVKDLVSGNMISTGSVMIDAGFPSGDMEFDSVAPKAAFLTPVPNGVGPVTVISLLENAAELCYNHIL